MVIFLEDEREHNVDLIVVGGTTLAPSPKIEAVGPFFKT
jgi:hypothetical protein